MKVTISLAIGAFLLAFAVFIAALTGMVAPCNASNSTIGKIALAPCFPGAWAAGKLGNGVLTIFSAAVSGWLIYSFVAYVFIWATGAFSGIPAENIPKRASDA